MQKAYKSTGTFTRRIGNTNYRVNVFCDEAAEESFQNKALRLIRSEIGRIEKIVANGFQDRTSCGIINLPQMSRPA